MLFFDVVVLCFMGNLGEKERSVSKDVGFKFVRNVGDMLMIVGKSGIFLCDYVKVMKWVIEFIKELSLLGLFKVYLNWDFIKFW